MSVDLIKVINNSPNMYEHPINFYIVSKRSLYGDFIRSVEVTYYTNYKITDKYIASLFPDANLTVYWEANSHNIQSFNPNYAASPAGVQSVGLLKWYANKEDILNVYEELMNIFESITGKYQPDYFIKEIPALVYDRTQQDWIIHKYITEPVFITNMLSSRESRIDYINLVPMTGSQMIDIPFRIVQALHYFNNLVRAEKVPDWVYKIITDYEAYRLLDA